MIVRSTEFPTHDPIVPRADHRHRPSVEALTDLRRPHDIAIGRLHQFAVDLFVIGDVAILAEDRRINHSRGHQDSST